MRINIEKAAKVLKMNPSSIMLSCSTKDSISLEEYSMLVKKVQGTCSELYRMGADVYYDNNQEDVLAIPLLSRAVEEVVLMQLVC